MKKIVFGMLAVALSFSAMAQTTDNAGSNGKWKKKEFREKHIKNGENFDKLNLTDDQKAQIKTLNEKFRQQMQDLKKQGDITVNQQKQKREALVREHKEKITAILTSEQRQQAETIAKDFRGGNKEGGRGDRFEEMEKNLNLTPEQSAKITSLNATFKASLQKIRQNDALSKDEKREQMKSVMQQHKSDMEALLTNDQKEQLKSRQKNRFNRTTVK